MDINWLTKSGIMSISIIKYLQKIIEEFSEVIKSTSPSPAGDYFFKVREAADCKVLLEEQARQFHRTVAPFLFLGKKACLNIKQLVSFNVTSVKKTDEDD